MRFEQIWNEIRDEYLTGAVVSERDLQASLICKFRVVLRKHVRIVAEPTWYVRTSKQIPDIVIAEHGAITDVFELKFVPHACADAKADIRKLVGYAEDAHAQWPVQLRPDTGQWAASIPMAANCRFHFVAISRYEAAAVWPESLKHEVPELVPKLEGIHLWYGRVRANSIPTEDWGIQYAT